MNQIDLEPREYRRIGKRPFIDLMKRQKVFLWLAIPCGIWAAAVLYSLRQGWIDVDRNIFIALTLALGPALLLWFSHWLFIDRHDDQ